MSRLMPFGDGMFQEVQPLNASSESPYLDQYGEAKENCSPLFVLKVVFGLVVVAAAAYGIQQYRASRI